MLPCNKISQQDIRSLFQKTLSFDPPTPLTPQQVTAKRNKSHAWLIPKLMVTNWSTHHFTSGCKGHFLPRLSVETKAPYANHGEIDFSGVTLVMMGPSDSVEEPFRIGYIHAYITIRYSHNNPKNLSSLADR